MNTTKKFISQEELGSLINDHKEWLKDVTKGKRFSINAKDLRNMNLRDLDFTNAYITGCDFTGSILTNIDFTNADLSYSDFTGSDLTESNFYNTCMIRTNLERCIMVKCNFTDTNLKAANLKNANLLHSNLASSNLYGAMYDITTLFPARTIVLNGYHYDIIIHQQKEPNKQDSYQVGCQVLTAEEWLSKSKEELIEMDGRTALRFYPQLVKLIKFFSNL